MDFRFPRNVRLIMNAEKIGPVPNAIQAKRSVDASARTP